MHSFITVVQIRLHSNNKYDTSNIGALIILSRKLAPHRSDPIRSSAGSDYTVA